MVRSKAKTTNINKGSKEYSDLKARLFNARAQTMAKAFLGKLRTKAIITYR